MHHSRGWHGRRLATRPLWTLFLLAIPAGPAVAQTDVDVGFNGTINEGEIINLTAPGGTVNGAVINNGSLWFDNGDLTSSTVSAPISGTGLVAFLQPVNTTLSGNNSWTGGMYIYSGTVTLSGSLAGGAGLVEVDGVDDALLAISGSAATGFATLGTTANGSAVVSSGGQWSSTSLTVGQGGTSSLLVNGGLVSTGDAYFAREEGSVGNLTITSGSFLSSGDTYLGYVGSSAVNVSGGQLLSAADLYFGYEGGVNAVLSAGAINAGGILFVGKGSTSSLNVTGGSVTSAGGVIGQTTGGVGTVTMSGGSWSVTNDLEVGSTAEANVSGGQGFLTISGGNVTSARALVGNFSRSIGNVSVTSGTWTLTGTNPDGNLQVGYFGSGTMTISGGLVSGSGGNIGFTDTGNGTLIMNGGQLNLGGLLNVGNFTRGALHVWSGTLSTAQVIVGAGLQSSPLRTGSGSVSVTGGTWINSLSLTVGFRGNGTYTQSGGYVSAAQGFIGSDSLLATTGTGSVTVTGGTLAFAGNLAVGNSVPGSTGGGALTIADGGFVSVGDTLSRAANGALNLNGGGTLSIGVGGPTGSLGTAVLDDGLLIFNRSTDYLYLESITGTGAVAKYGNSVLTFAGTSSYSGPTNVYSGTLNLLGQLGLTDVTVHSGATLSGTGVVLGSVTIGANGTISPGAVGGGVGMLTTSDFFMTGASSLAVLQITGSNPPQYDRVTAQTLTDALTWGGGSLSITMNTTPSYVEGTEFYLFSEFGGYSGAIQGITFNGGGTDFAGLTFSDSGDGTWTTNRNGLNQGLRFDTSTGTLAVVPEPSTWLLLTTGAVSCGLVGWRRRRSRRATVAGPAPQRDAP